MSFPDRCHRVLLLRLSAALLSAVLTAPSGWARTFTTAQEAEWREQIRAALFAVDPLPELAPTSHGEFEPAPGVVAERVTYATQFGLRVPAIVYRSKTATARGPGLIVVNGHGGDKYSWYAFYAGIAYARAGAVVVTYDPAGEGERHREHKSGTRAHDEVVPPDEMGRRLGGLMMTDLMQAVSYLAQRRDVDPSRLAAMGYSMGSFVVSLTGAVERRLKAVVLAGGGNLDGPGGYWDGSKPMCQGLPYRALTFLGDRPAVLYALHASRGRTLIYNGLEDTTVAITSYGEKHFADLRERTIALRGSDQNVFETGFVPGAGHRPYFVTTPVALWLERVLDFPNWTEASIRELPETHIAEWASRNKVDLDPLYATEHREGGTRAVGTGVPGLTRDQLSVFTAAQWNAQKDRMIHESWLAEAAKRLGPASR